MDDILDTIVKRTREKHKYANKGIDRYDEEFIDNEWDLLD